MRSENYFVDGRKIPSGVRPEHLARALDSVQARAQEEAETVARGLRAWQQKYRARRMEVLGQDRATRLREFVTKNRRPEPTGGRELRAGPEQRLEERRSRRAKSARFVKSLGVNREGLDRLHEDARAEIEKIVGPASAVSDGADIKVLEQGFEHRPLEFTKPPELQLKFPAGAPSRQLQGLGWPVLTSPYAWFNRGGQTFQTGSGKSLKFNSYLWGDVGLTGSNLWSKNWDADNHDVLSAHREGGFLIPFTVAASAPIKVTFDVRCMFTNHCIETNNEWGFSTYAAKTWEKLVLGVLWNLEKLVPDSETINTQFSGTLFATGNGDNYPGLSHPVPNQQLQSVTMTTQKSYPKGATVWVYVGTGQNFYAAMDDVGVNIYLDSAWLIPKITVWQI